MPQNNTYLSALDKSKLDKIKEVELASSKKVHLSVLKDAIKMSGELQNSTAELDKLVDRAEEADANIREANNAGNKVYEDLNSEVTSIKDLQDDAFIILRKLEEGAKALGLQPTELPDYADLLDAMNKSVSNIDGAENTADNLGDLIGR